MVMAAAEFNASDALIALLTVESLLFALFSVAIGLGASSGTVAGSLTRGLANAGAVVLTILAVGSGTAWVDVFARSNAATHGFSEWCPAVALALGLAVQPAFAWVIARNV
jgi:hypothetical protein